MHFQSTLENINFQMYRLYYHLEECNAALDDLRNYGSSADLSETVRKGLGITLV